ncbi:MAG: hypothetical protein ACR65T_10530 [Methylocystis sp.]|uniref:hypothetical protein n=1 Tax=Methylocystis sp. TaxID=1911079 RepID=UPI003DA3D7D4
MKHYGIEDPAVPLFVRGSRYVMGFDSAQTTGRDILALLSGQETVARRAAESKIIIPLIGEIDPTHHSLLALTALMGMSDGFNPCAMWVLIYLISLIVNIQDRRKSGGRWARSYSLQESCASCS